MGPFRKPASRSIFDADAPPAQQERARRAVRAPGRRTVAGVAAAALVLAGALGATWAASHRGGGYASADRGSSVLAASPPSGRAAAPGRYVDVLLDGWSYRTLQSAPLDYTASSGDPVPVEFTPASAADLAELMATTPALVTQALSRMVTDDPSLTCSSAGCRTARGPLSADLLLHPGDVPVLGASYRGYGITSGLYLARLQVGSAASVTLSAPGYAAADLPTQALGAVDEYGQRRSPAADNGYLRQRYLLGAGLGRLFTQQSAWLGGGTDPHRYLVSPASAPATGAGDALVAQSPTLLATGGLAAPFPLAQSWSATHLTYASSPTTGCGVEALCAPVTLSPTLSRDVRDAAAVCAPSAGPRGAAAAEDVALTVTLPAPTHQFGLGASLGRWGATPALVSGTQRVHLSAVGLFDGDPLAERAAGGRVEAGPGSADTLTSMLAAVRFDGVHWHRC